MRTNKYIEIIFQKKERCWKLKENKRNTKKKGKRKRERKKWKWKACTMLKCCTQGAEITKKSDVFPAKTSWIDFHTVVFPLPFRLYDIAADRKLERLSQRFRWAGSDQYQFQTRCIYRCGNRSLINEFQSLIHWRCALIQFEIEIEIDGSLIVIPN